MAGVVAGGASIDSPRELLDLVNDVVKVSAVNSTGDVFKKDCTDLVRRISLLSHLFEEIRNFNHGDFRPLEESTSSSSSATTKAASTTTASTKSAWLSDLMVALKVAKRLLSVAGTFNSSDSSSDGAAEKIAFQFQCVTWRLERALRSIPYDNLDVSEEVQEQVQLVRDQLRRAAEKYGSLTSIAPPEDLSRPLEGDMDFCGSENSESNSCVEKTPDMDNGCTVKLDVVAGVNGLLRNYSDAGINLSDTMRKCISSPDLCSKDAPSDDHVRSASKSPDEIKKPEAVEIPEDFLCPISIELMKDPVIVATGQTYERSYIQRWIDGGNTTCPKTQQKLENLTLTPNYVLRSLISQWCTQHNVEQPSALANGKIKKTDGTYRDVCGEIAAIEALVRKLSSRSIVERRAAVTEIRSLSKRSTDNRILIAEAGAVPALVSLLTSDDELTQENAVTSILNLSIYESNKGLIMLAGAIPSIVHVLRVGSMEVKENAAATIFSLSLADENKIIIGASGAIPALVDLLKKGSSRGKKDAATALFNLCVYQGNKGRAVRAGIVDALLQMLIDSNNSMVDEALTIMSVLASHPEAKSAIVKAGTIPILIDLLRTGLPRNKENSAAILLVLCKRDPENLACISRLGAFIPLTELAKNGTERAKRKASSILEHLRKIKLL